MVLISNIIYLLKKYIFFFSSRRRHTRSLCDWSSDVCSSDLVKPSPLSSDHRSSDRYAPNHRVASVPAPNCKFFGLACCRCYDHLLLWVLLDCSSVLVLRRRSPLQCRLADCY